MSVYKAAGRGNIEYLNEAFSSNKINVSWMNDQEVSLLSFIFIKK